MSGLDARRNLSALALLALFAVPCVAVPALADRWLLPQRTVFVGITLLAALLSLLLDRSPIPRLPRRAAIGLAATAAALLVAAARASDPSAALDALALDLCAMLFALFVLARLGDGLAPGAVASAIVAAALVQSLLGPIQIASGAPSVDPEGKLAFTGTLGNPEYVAALCGIALCLVPALPAPRRARIAIGVVLALTLLLTRSRGACLAAAGAAVIAWLPRRRLAALAAIAAAGAAIVLVSGTRSASGRVLVWLIAGREAIGSHGLGVGLGGFRASMVGAQSWVLEHGGARFADGAAMVSRAHDEPLDALAEGGIALLAAGALLLSVPLAAAWKRRDGWSAALFFVALFSLVSFPLHEPAALAATAAIAAVQIGGSARRLAIPTLRVPAAVALAALFCLHAARSVDALAASRLEARATESLRRGRFLEADARTRAALAFRPGDPALELLRGRLLYHAFRPREALAWAEARDRIAGPSVDGLKLEGMAELDLGRVDDALATYRRLEAAFPRQVTAHAQIGRILLARGDREGAARELALAVACPAANHKAAVDRLRAGDRLRSLRDGRPDLLQ